MVDTDTTSPETEPKAQSERTVASRLRHLDFDDLFLLSHLLEGNTIAATARYLGLTQPAITQRVRKIEKVFHEAILQKAGRHVKLTKVGTAICERAADALALMRELSNESLCQPVTIGASPDLAERLLWPAVFELRRTSPAFLFHAHVGSSTETIALIEAGAIDACLTTQEQPSGALRTLDVADEDYIFVANPEEAKRIRSVNDLMQSMLIEIDRSLPHLRTIAQGSRAGLKFRDVWYLGSVPMMVSAIVAGEGVGVLPLVAAKNYLSTGKLVPILEDLSLSSHVLRLVYRKERSLEPAFERLADTLRHMVGRQ